MKLLSKLFLFLLVYSTLSSCRRDNDDSKDLPQKSNIANVKYAVNVYLENSASMFGYITGDTEYKRDVRELLSQLQFHYSDKNVNLYLINSDIYPIKSSNKLDYITNLDSKNFALGDIYKSEINKVFSQVIKKTDEKTISIVISDCIYAVSGKASGLSVQKTGIKDAFLRKSKNDFTLTTAFVKLNSKFTGVYYDSNNLKHNLKSVNRPYYYAVLGSELALSNLGNKFSFSNNEIKGVEEKVVLTSENYSKKVFYTLVKTTSDVGQYKILNDASTNESKKGLEDIQMNDRSKGNFTFVAAVDLSSIPISAEYALNKNNYQRKEGNYIIENIEPYNSITSKKLRATSLALLRNYHKKPTHLITFTATNKNYSNLKFVLKNQIPQWVTITNTEDDSDQIKNKNKTFGFRFLIEGIHEANQIINPKSREFLEFDIIINK